MRLEPRSETPVAWALAAPLLAVAAALGLCAIPLWIAGADVLRAYGLILTGSLGSFFALSETLARATPIMLTGLAAAVAFRARLWNIGGEGQLYAGALAAVALGTGALDLPGYLLLPLVLAGGASAGAVLMLGPTILKTRLGVDEVVTTLLLNFVVLLFVGMMLEGPMQDPMGMGWPQSAPVLDQAVLPPLVARGRVHAGLILAVVLGVVVWFVVARTIWGFELRATGINARAARFAGMPVERVLWRTALVSGALAGLAGVGEVTGLKGYLTQDLSPGYGYAGIVVAMLAQLHPLGVLLAALYVAAVFVGADSMSRALGISSYIANIIVATSLLTMLLAGLAIRFRIRR